MNAPLLLLFDLTGMVHRAWHGGAVGGAGALAIHWAEKLLRQRGASYAAAAVDLPRPTFRHELWPGYKANRQRAEAERADIRAQVKKAILAGREIGLRSAWAAGFEADDLIAALAGRGHIEGLRVEIAARDKDFCQLVSDRVVMVDPQTGGLAYDPALVLEKYGVRPDQFIDYLALVGDTSDGYPGCPGMGPVRAAELLAWYGSLANALKYAGRGAQDAYAPGASYLLNRPKIKALLVEHADKIVLSRKLAELRTDAPVSELSALALPGAPSQRVAAP